MRRSALCIACALPLVLGVVAVAQPVLVSQGMALEVAAGAHGKAGDGVDRAELERRLAEKGMVAGSPILVRIFKLESELEVWMHKGERFELLAVYPICHWSGKLGPKLSEGDKQSPEGLYSVGPRQLHRTGRWRRSLDIGFPNTFDKANGRTGSYILVHGGCTSTGCYAMTNPVMEEIFTLSEAALAQGQERIQVHVFPFRMTQANLAAHADSEWNTFWSSLKEAHDLFERTRIPPQVSVCNNRYVVGQAAPSDTNDCAANASEASVASARLRSMGRVRHARNLRQARRARLARRLGHWRQARRGAGRNARHAYAAARAARVAGYAKRRR